MSWAAWWVWAIAAAVLAILEVLAPAFVLLGFAIGAGIIAVLFLVGGPLAAWLAGSVPATLVVFAVLSLAAWVVLRKVFGVREGQVKLFDHDIND
ncbi:NfeD family protein [Oceaniglobus roseus]|uniref:NfeD family protein n=1 Tax=Oceaniglobus roseus TaxID=1737570 RepID=UPI000C7F0C9F|nr:hypothetical protein [Kandeliimicrobium roseum]